MLHDARKQNENHDPEHGDREAALARECNVNLFHLDNVDMQNLNDACHYHAYG